MSQRLAYFQHAPDLAKKLMDLSLASKSSSLGATLTDLVNIRASQLNGCAFCLDMHMKEAKIHGERELRLYHISIWEESPLFSERERALLKITEAVTKDIHGALSPDLYKMAREHFSEVEMTELTFAIGIINLWNRMNMVAQTPPGSMDAAFGLVKAGLN